MATYQVTDSNKPIIGSSPLLRDSLGNTALDLVKRKLADPACDALLLPELRKVEAFLEAGMQIEHAIGERLSVICRCDGWRFSHCFRHLSSERPFSAKAQ